MPPQVGCRRWGTVQGDNERIRWTLAVVAGLLLLAGVNLWWVLTYRKGFPLNVDEAGYTSIALTDWLGFHNGGLHGWWGAIQNQTPNAPLLPALTSVLLIVKQGIMEGFAVLIGFFVLLGLAAYGIGRQLAGPRLGALAALAVATSEGALLFSREFVFALPTAALMSCAVFALLRSDRMRERRWAIACGVAVGLMMLARTMAVAFLPGLFAAALIGMIAVDRTELGRRFVNLGLGAVAALLVAATWYWNNLEPVYDYLTSFGYGSKSAYFGAEHAVISWGRFRAVADRVIYDDLLLPMTVLVLIGLVALAVVAMRRVRDSEDRRETALRLAASDAFAIGFVFAAGFAALMTSQNGGNGFSLPISMLLPPLAVLALRYYRLAVAPVAALVVAVAALNLAATSSLWRSLAEPRFVSVPGFDSKPWVNGIPRPVDAIRAQVPGPRTKFVDRDLGWPEDDEAVARQLLPRIYRGGLESGVVAWSSRHRAISANSVELALLLYHDTSIPFTQLEAEPTDSVANYVRELRNVEHGPPGMLLTMSRNQDDFPPLVTQGRAEEAARIVGFHQVWATTLPDGRKLRLWVRPAQPAPAAPAPGSRRG
jgi:HPP family/Dolichyl-phosphate-mannose-protein mannosyltransferase